MLCFLFKLINLCILYAQASSHSDQTYSARPKSIADFEAALTRAESGGADVVQAECFRCLL